MSKTQVKSKESSGHTAQPRTYRYIQEISQMMFVAGEVQDPLVDTVRQVEDIVRGQVIELAIRARQIAARRGSRNLAAEDLIFLIRDDRAKVNRLRTYLSWKDVRKNAKDSGGDAGAGVGAGAGGGTGGVGGTGEEEPGEGDDALKSKTRQRQIVKLPWEVTTVYADFLRHFKGARNGARANVDDEESEEDEDELEANEDMLQRLRDADLVTKNMSREEYSHYSDCRQASFTYRKAKRFREFVNLSAYLDVKPNDDIIDILGFLCYEMVHTLCTSALKVKEIHSPTPADSLPITLLPLVSSASNIHTASSNTATNTSTSDHVDHTPIQSQTLPDPGAPAVNPLKRSISSTNISFPNPSTTTTGASSSVVPPSGSSPSRKRPMTATVVTGATTTTTVVPGGKPDSPEPAVCMLFERPSQARTALTPGHITEAFGRIQESQGRLKGVGVGNFRGAGPGRRRLVLF
ncbi:Histone acetyltransferase PCAF/SAGA, subunit SUPT3H/SPT3 [Phaffia rhodozyma]|uniref:Histone acetyltransferase PCAF/SAGA, subunit SUPT3H/SPT3 n=1 Tax=Phaffia rhodozyma TaxID=264483 RepID=A0A0F7SJL5_PHARH|nr:Histone acetyltransferase PCAF/SAGA, subunit SUPT3H/SPT3 [Phaffia rhodozyma]